MPKELRKRKHDVEVEIEISAPKNKFKPFDEAAQAEEEKLTKILFGGTSNFLQSLEEAEQEPHASTSDVVDSGVGETESDDSEKDRKPVWHDEDDDGIDVRDALKIQGRFLPRGGQNTIGNQYSKLLKHKFESIVGTPTWADLNKKNKNDSDSDEEILQTCGFIKKAQKLHLTHGLIELKRVMSLNQETKSEGPYINVVEFHPTSMVGLVAGSSGIATLYAVDGKRNTKLHSVKFEKFSVKCAKFHKGGNEVILGSIRPYIYNYDLISAKASKIRLPRDLIACKKFIISPNGKHMAVAGEFSDINIICTTSRELLFSLKQNSNVSSFTFNQDGSKLFSHSNTSEVTIWDMNMRRVIHKFQDSGCIRGTTIDISNTNQFLATGSAEGVVNVYDMESVLTNTDPPPRKSVMNLTTSIDDLKFNHTSEILAFSSSHIKNSIRLLHLGTNTVFSNFPNPNLKLGNINVINFTPGSGYLAIGNSNSEVPLFRLKHYTSY